jgi:hypothetical protein
MAYDAARGEVIMFGGWNGSYEFAATWAWDGATWTQQHPVSSPPGRDGMGMAYDVARAEVVMFDGCTLDSFLNDTWTWDGTNWTEQHPATSPSIRCEAGMAYDAARAEVVLFGGLSFGTASIHFSETWIWDGTTWTQQHPATSPSARSTSGSMGLAYDVAQNEVVLFGGGLDNDHTYFGDTWTWDGTNWSVPFVAHLHLSPNSGPPGTTVLVKATGFAAFEEVKITFIDSVNGETVLRTSLSDASGRLTAQVKIPADATAGAQKITVAGLVSHQKAKATFTVT